MAVDFVAAPVIVGADNETFVAEVACWSALTRHEGQAALVETLNVIRSIIVAYLPPRVGHSQISFAAVALQHHLKCS